MSAERLREEQVSDAVRSITPGPDTTGISALTIPPADLARATFRAIRAERRANRAEQDRDYLLRVIARLEGHNDDHLARLRHLGE